MRFLAISISYFCFLFCCSGIVCLLNSPMLAKHCWYDRTYIDGGEKWLACIHRVCAFTETFHIFIDTRIKWRTQLQCEFVQLQTLFIYSILFTFHAGNGATSYENYFMHTRERFAFLSCIRVYGLFISVSSHWSACSITDCRKIKMHFEIELGEHWRSGNNGKSTLNSNTNTHVSQFMRVNTEHIRYNVHSIPHGIAEQWKSSDTTHELHMVRAP